MSTYILIVSFAAGIRISAIEAIVETAPAPSYGGGRGGGGNRGNLDTYDHLLVLQFIIYSHI